MKRIFGSAIEAVDADILGLEHDLPAGGEARLDQVLGDLGLAVDGDRAADQRLEVDAMQPAAEAEADALMRQALPPHALADACLVQHGDRALLEHAGADAPFDIGAAAALEDHRLDAPKVQQLRQQQPGRSRSDDADLRAHASRHPTARAVAAR